MLGFLNLNKPSGFTSHDCVAKVRKLLRQKRVGHGGTLDPVATGVLPIAVGKATRLLQFLPSDKAYLATVRFGVRTATDDLDGDLLVEQPASDLDRETIRAALTQFQGKITQIPPAYSAIQVEGKRLYELARAGEAVNVPSREVEVYDIAVKDWRSGDYPEIDLEIACGAGTYIRAIARDLGDMVGTGATLANLIRTQSSGFALNESIALEELSDRLERETFQLLPPDTALAHLTSVTLSDEYAKRWCQGQRLPHDNPAATIDPLRVYRNDTHFLGIGQFVQTETQWILAPKIVFPPD